jgi:predicted transposase YbfD/YdcC
MLLCDAQIANTRKVTVECSTGKVINLGSLYRRFQGLRDNRKAKGKRYALETILLGMFLAKLCGEDKPSGIAEWVKLRAGMIVSALGLKRKEMPSHHTYRRILADVVDADEFEKLARAHHRRHGESGYHVVICMDGKVVRGTIDLEPSDGLCLLAVFLPGEGVTLAQIALESEQNEITAAPLLLEWVDLRNKVVIGDVLHTQRQVSIQIGRVGSHYIWTVKGNQPQLLQDLQDWFDPQVELIPGMGDPARDFRSAKVINKGYGRIEVRTLTTSSQLNDFLPAPVPQAQVDWPFLQQVFKLERYVNIQKTGKTRHETVFGITSLPADQTSPSQLLRMLRSYWQIEKGLHYPRVVTMREDQTRFKNHSAAHVMAIINNVLPLRGTSPRSSASHILERR